MDRTCIAIGSYTDVHLEECLYLNKTWKLNCCFIIIAQSKEGHKYIKHWPQIITKRLKLEEN